MKVPEPPDLTRPRSRLIAVALVVAVTIGVATGLRDAPSLVRTLGDTDDAMRLVLVRALLHGQGWWDQHLTRLQPPLGLYMHWSRLLDGGIAALNGGFDLVAPPARAEWLTRLLWPLLWLFPAVLAALWLTDGLAERGLRRRPPGAGLACAVFLLTNLVLYIQFHPGRVDHHDVQMTLFLLALAGACERRRPRMGALVAGAASGLGLAIGLEALVFEAAVGAALALRWMFDPAAGRALGAYGLALSAVILSAFLIQTPPGRWSVSACDALAFNSASALAVAGLGAAAAAAALGRTGVLIRTGALALLGGVVLLIYLGLDPGCRRGPFADVDPAIKGFWLSHVQEMKPWLADLKAKPDAAILIAAPALLGALGALWLARRGPTRADGPFRLAVGLLLLTSAAGFSGVRMAGYADWVAMPILAVACADLADTLSRRLQRPRLALLALIVLLATPEAPSNAVTRASRLIGSLTHKGAKPAPEAGDHCFETRPYRALAAAGPPGLVLSEIDLGPFILANTADSALAAPYHRMSWGMVAARRVLQADADDGAAEARARALGVRYVLECDAHRGHSDRDGMASGSLQKRLDDDEDQPDWLERVNPVGSVLEVFRVRAAPSAGAPGPRTPARSLADPAAKALPRGGVQPSSGRAG